VHSLERFFHRCFLPSFSSFGWGFSSEKIKMWKVNGWQTMDTTWWQKLILPLARFAKKNIKMWIATYNVHRINMLHYQNYLISKGKSYLSFNRGESFFRNQPIRNKNCLLRPCLLTDQDKMSNFLENLP
jgi:hypothetical protein